MPDSQPAEPRPNTLRPVGETAHQPPDATVPPVTDPAAAGESLAFLAPAEQPDEVGRIAHYRVLKQLGAGGMGVVLQAEDTQLRRPVALKVMRPEVGANPANRERFLREARAAAALKHDNVVTIYQVGEDRGVPFIALEFLKGKPLDRWLDRTGTPTPAQAVRIGREIANGLAAAHEQGLIHRDVKPGNVWLEAPTGRVKLLDFGLARSLKDDSQITKSGVILGTPAYMAPEQARSAAIDHRCDLWALGVVLYRLLAGRLPFRGDDLLSTLAAIALDTPTPVRDLNPDVPPALADLIDRLMCKDPAGRPSSAADVARELRAIERDLAGKKAIAVGTGTGVALPSGPAASTTLVPVRPRRRWPLAAMLLAVAVVAGVLVTRPRERRDDGREGEPVAEPVAAVARPDTARDWFQPPDPPATASGVDLLPLVDPVKDIVDGGPWTRAGSTVVSADGHSVRVLELPYRPPAEYDFAVEFTPRGVCNVHQEIVLPNGRQCRWAMGAGAGGRGYGFEHVDKKWSSVEAENPARVELPNLQAGRRYRSRVEVRRAGVRALLDDKPVCEFAALDRLGANGRAWPRDPRQLGVSVWGGPVEFHSAVVWDVSGSGTVTRPAGERSPGAIDALALVNSARPVNIQGGTGERRPTGWLVVGHKADGQPVHTALNMTPRPPAEYDLTVELTTVEPGRLVFRLPLPTGTSCQAFVGAHRDKYGRRYGYEMADGHGDTTADNPSVRDGPERAIGKRMTVRVEVRRSGLRTLVDGAVAAEWADLSRVSWPRGAGNMDPGVLGVTVHGGAVEFHRIEITPPAAPPLATIDLLALVDPAKDAKEGTWERQGGDLVGTGPGTGGNPGHAIIGLPYRPPAEYDFTVTYTRKAFAKVVQQIPLPDRRACLWTMGHGNGEWVAFEFVDGKAASDEANPTRKRVDWQDRRYTSTVEVRRDGLRALLDGQVITEFRGDRARLRLPRYVQAPDPTALGLALYAGPVAFHSATVTVVSGRGTVTRPANP